MDVEKNIAEKVAEEMAVASKIFARQIWTTAPEGTSEKLSFGLKGVSRMDRIRRYKFVAAFPFAQYKLKHKYEY